MDMGRRIRTHQDLDVYQLAFDTAMKIFEYTKSFPDIERFALTDQIRRSSRSVCANVAEAWRKRRYQAAFIDSLNHAEAEAAETQVWLEFSEECQYLEQELVSQLYLSYDYILGKIVNMIRNPDQWIL